MPLFQKPTSGQKSATVQPATPASRPRVVIIGAGFGGLAATRALAGAEVEVTLVDRRNHHVFQPLLYQVATAALSPADIAGPIRAIVCDQPNVQVILDAVCAIDRVGQTVALESGRSLPYDWLIVATGARHSYFGRDDWAAHAPGIKTIEDATAVRRKILLALERAETETETDPVRRQALLTFARHARLITGEIEPVPARSPVIAPFFPGPAFPNPAFPNPAFIAPARAA